MQHVKDRTPGPDLLAESAEDWDRLFGALAQRNMLDLARVGMSAADPRFQRSRRQGGSLVGHALPFRLQRKLRRIWRQLSRGLRPLEILALVQRGMELNSGQVA